MATPVGGFDPGGWQLADRRAKGGRADATERSNGAGQSAGIRPSLAGAEMGRTNGGMGARMDAVEWPTGAQGKALGQALPSGAPNVSRQKANGRTRRFAASKPVGAAQATGRFAGRRVRAAAVDCAGGLGALPVPLACG